MIAKELFKGTIRTIVLQLLAKNKKMYGYELMQTISTKTSGKIKLTFGSLYPILHKLESDGLIYSESVKLGKRIRKYYLLTDSGIIEKDTKLDELKEFIATLNGLINDGDYVNA